jgi:hypothetical protein
MTSPVELGFELEHLIHNALSKINDFECLRENKEPKEYILKICVGD